MPLTQQVIDQLRRLKVKLCVQAGTEERDDALYLENFNQYLSDFDLLILFEEMDEHAGDYNIAWTTRKACVNKPTPDSFFCIIEFEGHLNGQPGQVVEIRRAFRFKNQCRKVEHQRFNLPASVQGRGFAKAVLRTFYAQYRKAGIDTISVGANMDVGGYAWAKYGFRATKKEVKKVLDKVEEVLNESSKKSKVSRSEWLDAWLVVDAYYRRYLDEVPFPMYLLADKEYGKKLLLEASWQGELDLHNLNDCSRFDSYLGIQ